MATGAVERDVPSTYRLSGYTMVAGCESGRLAPNVWDRFGIGLRSVWDRFGIGLGFV